MKSKSKAGYIMEIKEIAEILRLMDEHKLSEMTLEGEGYKLHLQKGGQQVVSTVPVMQAPSAVAAPMHAAPTPAPAAPAPAARNENIVEITSPMVGTFYRAPAPGAEPFVKVGDNIDSETTVCIIEAMKVINEIKAEMKGKIVEILVENAEPVEFGQPLFLVEKA